MNQIIKSILIQKLFAVTIGILTQPLILENFIFSNQIFFLEQSGFKTVPIIWSDKDIKTKLASVDGIFLQGGDPELVNQTFGTMTDYQLAVNKILDQSVSEYENNRDFVVLGHCLGFENFVVQQCFKDDHLTDCLDSRVKVEKIELTLQFNQSDLSNTIQKQFPMHLIDQMKRKKITANVHEFSLGIEKWNKQNYDKEFDLISTSKYNDFEFVSTIQHKKQKWQGIQYHPEKNNFNVVSNSFFVRNNTQSQLVSKLISFEQNRLFNEIEQKRGFQRDDPKEQILNLGKLEQMEMANEFILIINENL